jgi:hypothetical protein
MCQTSALFLKRVCEQDKGHAGLVEGLVELAEGGPAGGEGAGARIGVRAAPLAMRVLRLMCHHDPDFANRLLEGTLHSPSSGTPLMFQIRPDKSYSRDVLGSSHAVFAPLGGWERVARGKETSRRREERRVV